MNNFNPRTHRGVRPNCNDLLNDNTWFQSTHPSWGATSTKIKIYDGLKISIHAPIVGCDSTSSLGFYSYWYFNPRTHRGVRRNWKWNTWMLKEFQSTHPSWGATAGLWVSKRRQRNFNPRTHRGVRLYIRHQQAQNQYISIHAPIVGCDREEMREELYVPISIHAPIVGCDWIIVRFIVGSSISIHAPIVGCDSSNDILLL